MPVTIKEARELKKLDGVWDSISTVVGLYEYFRILGIPRTRQILKAVGEGKKVEMTIIKVMVCGRCGIHETVAPISEGEKFALGIDPRYRCFACRTLEEAGL
jgi:hypothetical protein